MTHRTLYLIGYPGSGKSTTMRALHDHLGCVAPEQHVAPIPHLRWLDTTDREVGIIELGRIRESFSGTDALAMNINPKAIDFVQQDWRVRWIVGEGDRLANQRFLDACPDLVVVLLDIPVAVAKERAAARAVSLGTQPQNDTWWRGRVTKVDNLARTYSPIRLDACAPSEHLAAELATVIGHG